MQLFDSHCHLDFPKFAPGRELYLERARARGVSGWFVPGCTMTRWAELGRLAACDDIWVGVGQHPYWSEGGGDVTGVCEALFQSARQFGAVAIGECGLDSGRGAPLAAQIELFEGQLALARELDLPVVVHQVGAREEFLACVSRVGLPEAGGVVHGFASDRAWGQALIRRGFLLGIGPAVTRSHRKRLREAVPELPLDRLVIETDAPEQGVSLVGQALPDDLERVCLAVSTLTSVVPEIVAETTGDTARRLYGL